jgi:hypothetical protein
MSTMAEYMREWRKNNPGRAYQYTKEWRKKNPAKYQAMKKKYYARFAGAINNINHGHIWSTEELILLEADELTDRELHVLIGRSVNAIQIRRSRMLSQGA